MTEFAPRARKQQCGFSRGSDPLQTLQRQFPLWGWFREHPRYPQPCPPSLCHILGSGLIPGVPVPQDQSHAEDTARGRVPGQRDRYTQCQRVGVSRRAPVPSARPGKTKGSGGLLPAPPEVISSFSPSVFLANSSPLKFKCCRSPFLTLCRNISLFI